MRQAPGAQTERRDESGASAPGGPARNSFGGRTHQPVLPLASCPLSDVLALFGSPVPRPRRPGRAQQFLENVRPVDVGREAIQPRDVSVVDGVGDYQYKPCYPQRVHYSISSNATILTFEY